MRKLTIASAVALLALTGCSGTGGASEATEAPPSAPSPTKPPVVKRASPEVESEFLAATYDTLPEQFKSEELRADVIAMGYDFCKLAARNGTTTGDEAQRHIDTLNTEDPAVMYSMTLAFLVGVNSGELFCPDYAGPAELAG